MQRITFLSASAGLALLAATPASAQLGAVIGAQGGTTVGPAARESAVDVDAEATAAGAGTVSVKPTDGASIRGTASSTTKATTNANTNTQGAANASVSGLVNAQTNSALGGAGNVALNNVAGGTAVVGTGGTTLGTVTGRVKNRAGATVGLQVALAGGGTATIPASSFNLSGSTLTTTWVNAKR